MKTWMGRTAYFQGWNEIFISIVPGYLTKWRISGTISSKNFALRIKWKLSVTICSENFCTLSWQSHWPKVPYTNLTNYSLSCALIYELPHGSPALGCLILWSHQINSSSFAPLLITPCFLRCALCSDLCNQVYIFYSSSLYSKEAQ